MKTNTLTALFVLIVSAVIGYNTTSEPVNANPTTLVIPKFVEVPRISNGFDLNINMKNELVEITENSDKNVNVSIQKKDSIVYRYKTIKKEVPVYVRVTPSYSHVKSSSSVLMKNTTMQVPEKITLKN